MVKFRALSTYQVRINIWTVASILLLALSTSAWVPDIFEIKSRLLNGAAWGISAVVVSVYLSHIKIYLGNLLIAIGFSGFILISVVISAQTEAVRIGANQTLALLVQSLFIALLIRASQRAKGHLTEFEVAATLLNLLICMALFTKGAGTSGYSLASLMTDWSFKIKWFDLVFMYLIFVDPSTLRRSRLFFLLSCIVLSYLTQSKIGMLVFFALAILQSSLMVTRLYSIILLLVGLLSSLFFAEPILLRGATLVDELNFSYAIGLAVLTLEARLDILTAAWESFDPLKLFGDFGWQLQVGDLDGRGSRFGLYLHSILGIALQFGIPAFSLYLLALFKNMRELLAPRTFRSLISAGLLFVVLLLIRPIFSLVALTLIWLPAFTFFSSVSTGVIHANHPARGTRIKFGSRVDA